MTDRTVTAIPAATQVPAARLEPDAISAAQDTIIGMGNSAPTVALGCRWPRSSWHRPTAAGRSSSCAGSRCWSSPTPTGG